MEERHCNLPFQKECHSDMEYHYIYGDPFTWNIYTYSDPFPKNSADYEFLK